MIEVMLAHLGLRTEDLADLLKGGPGKLAVAVVRGPSALSNRSLADEALRLGHASHLNHVMMREPRMVQMAKNSSEKVRI